MNRNESARLAGAIEFLKSHCGHFWGDGENHQGETFEAEFILKMIAGGNGAQISFRARQGEMTFHEERTWIASDLLRDRLCLWTISTNTSGVLALELREDAPFDAASDGPGDLVRRLRFGVGDPTRLDAFREEIQLDFMGDGSLRYLYSWGVPGEAFGEKNNARLRPTAKALPSSWL